MLYGGSHDTSTANPLVEQDIPEAAQPLAPIDAAPKKFPTDKTKQYYRGDVYAQADTGTATDAWPGTPAPQEQWPGTPVKDGPDYDVLKASGDAQRISNAFDLRFNGMSQAVG